MGSLLNQKLANNLPKWNAEWKTFSNGKKSGNKEEVQLSWKEKLVRRMQSGFIKAYLRSYKLKEHLRY
jgi:hypothetical protein